MKINHNISAMIANNQLQTTQERLTGSLERLSSGLKINKAADNAAGLAIANKINAQIKGLDQASQNSSDGQSVIQTAEGALSEIQSMLSRMRELAVQGANDTYTAEDKEAIQKEVAQLSTEIERISKDTEFNSQTLLNGKFDTRAYTDMAGVRVMSISDSIPSGIYNFSVTQLATKTTVTAGTGYMMPLTEKGKISINGEEVEFKEGETREEVYQKLRDIGEKVGVDVTIDSGKFVFTSQEFGSASNIEITGSSTELLSQFGLNTTAEVRGTDVQAEFSSEVKARQGVKIQTGTNGQIRVNGTNVNISSSDSPTEIAAKLSKGTGVTATYNAANDSYTIAAKDDPNTAPVMTVGGIVQSIGTTVNLPNDSGFTDTATITTSGQTIMVTDRNGVSLEVNAQSLGLVNVDVRDFGGMVLQIGANEGQELVVVIPEISLEHLGIDNLNYESQEGCSKAINQIDGAVSLISSARAKLGAYENRLGHAISSLDITSQNMTAAYSRIMDVDMAEEMSTYTNMNVLQQAGTSMLAQANELPQTVLQLLG